MPSASLVPAGDQTLPFTNSGMVQFKDVFTGAEKRSYNRAVDYQRVLRVAGKHNDFEEVGRTPRHHTFFEMLGNWSFGDYFKRDAILWAWGFLTQDLGIPPERLAATTYNDDEVAWNVWRDEIGLPPGADGEVGRRRCRRRQELLADGGDRAVRPVQRDPLRPRRAALRGPGVHPGPQRDLPALARDLEPRLHGVRPAPRRPRIRCRSRASTPGSAWSGSRASSSRSRRNYDTDLFQPIHARMRELLGHDPDAFEAERFSYQVIADHSRAVTFLVADGVLPSNEGRGYVLRRILRRAVRHGRLLGRREPFMAETATVVIDTMADAYPAPGRATGRDPRRHRPRGGAVRRGRWTRARSCSRRHFAGVAATERAIGRRPEDLPSDAPVLPGDVAFKLHDTFGFPFDLTVELAAEYGVAVDRQGFEAALAEQRERSRERHEGGSVEARRELRPVRRHPGTRRRQPVPRLRDDRRAREGRRDHPRRDRVRRADRPGPGRGDPRSDAVLRGRRRADRRPRRAPRGRRRIFALRGGRHAAAARRAHRPPRHDPRTTPCRRDGRRRGGRGASRSHDAQPHGHAPPPPRAAERRRRERAAGGLARDARLSPLRLPVRPWARARTRSRRSKRRSGGSSATIGPSRPAS